MKAISDEKNVSTVSVETIKSRPLIPISSTAKVGDALKIMKENNIRRLIVKENSKTLGIITQKKFLEIFLAKHLRFS